MTVEASVAAPSGTAQQSWAATSVRERLQVVARIRSAIAAQASSLLPLFSSELQRSRTDSLTAEILPLTDACRFLESEAERILRTRRLRNRARPFWLRSTDVCISREPLGVVLVIGPSNYPLFLPAVQMLQALTAGNRVIVKPGRGGGDLMLALVQIAHQAGLPADLISVLDESVASAVAAIRQGVDKIVITGSAESGRAVMREAAERLTPVIAELSGDDPLFVLASADLNLAARAIQFGTQLNGGATCIAPRRIYAHHQIAERLQTLLPHVPLHRFENEEQAARLANDSDYALGAAIFGDKSEARALAKRVCAGIVVINDVIVPTADPRVPFGGRKHSGFGLTRGAEGLLELTAVKTVIVRQGARLRHLEPLPANAESLFLGYLSAAHSGRVESRVKGWGTLVAAAMKMRRSGA